VLYLADITEKQKKNLFGVRQKMFSILKKTEEIFHTLPSYQQLHQKWDSFKKNGTPQ
jgi:hypothetical protein